MIIFLSRITLPIESIFYNEILTTYSLVATLYIIIRLCDVLLVKYLLYLFLLAFILQVFYIFLQLFHNLELHDYKLTQLYHLSLRGTLDNSGLCAGFLVSLSPTVFFLIKEKNKWLTYCFLTLMCILLVLTGSRAALISFIPIIYFFGNPLQIRVFKKLPIWVWLGILVITIIGLYFVRVQSAIGRLNIWKLTFLYSFDQPFRGIGFGEFPKAYQKWQIDYYINQNNSLRYFESYDLPNNCFNEPLQTFSELGLLGMVPFVIIFIVIYKSSFVFTKSLSLTLKITLFSVFLFSLFSYPLHSLPIFSFFIIVMALISKGLDSKWHIMLKAQYVLYLMVISIILCAYSFKYIYDKNNAVSDWLTAKSLKNRSLALLKYENIYPLLKENGQFLYDYGVILYDQKKFKESIEILSQSERILPKLESYLYIGRGYQGLGNLVNAKKNYLFCISSFPLNLKPQYYLLKLYLLQGDTLNAYNLSIKIVLSEVRVWSPEASEIINFAYDTIDIIKERKILIIKNK